MGTPTNWDKKFSFVVEIDGVARGAFARCSEIAAEAANVAYREGGRLHAHNAPGTVTFPEFTLERGATDDYDLYNWFRDTYDAAAGTGQVPPDLFRTLDIVQLDRAGDELKRFRCVKCYCRRWSAGDWDNDADEVRIETAVVVFDYFEQVPVA